MWLVEKYAHLKKNNKIFHTPLTLRLRERERECRQRRKKRKGT